MTLLASVSLLQKYLCCHVSQEVKANSHQKVAQQYIRLASLASKLRNTLASCFIQSINSLKGQHSLL